MPDAASWCIADRVMDGRRPPSAGMSLLHSEALTELSMTSDANPPSADVATSPDVAHPVTGAGVAGTH